MERKRDRQMSKKYVIAADHKFVSNQDVECATHIVDEDQKAEAIEAAKLNPNVNVIYVAVVEEKLVKKHTFIREGT